MLTSELSVRIEKLRQELNEYAQLNICLTNPKIVELSSMLDKLISKAQYLKNTKQRVRCSKRFTNRHWILRRYKAQSSEVAKASLYKFKVNHKYKSKLTS